MSNSKKKMTKNHNSDIFDRLMQVTNSETVAELSRVLDCNQHTLYTWRSRNVVPISKVKKKLPNVNTDWLLTGQGEMHNTPNAPQAQPQAVQNTRTKKVRLSNEIASIQTSSLESAILIKRYLTPVNAGKSNIQIEDSYEYFDLRALADDTFIVRVRGESMAGLNIHDGYEIFFRATNQYKNGDIVLARVNDEFTIKQIRNGDGFTLLNPANPEFDPIKVTPDLDFEVQGVKFKVMF